MRFNLCTGCDAKLPVTMKTCGDCAANGGKPADPYADVADVIAAETDIRRVEAQATMKTPTEGQDNEEDGYLAPGVPLYDGFHIDGDKRYQER